ncbi:non-canonical purine NTP pyrophosphatase [Candidatus Uhrbacteria bacterium]|nr:MAG: non-canonical purine NTP pyrophosphatase [Candidatus Uhrbacteria bacterium]
MIYFITGNEKKFNEMKAILPEIERLDIDLPEIQEIDPHAIIRAKLEAACRHHDGEFIVEDTSVSMECLNGLPGPFIKWFLQTVGTRGLAELAAKLGNDRAAVTIVIGYAKSAGDIQFFEGVANGRIVPPRGERGFAWDPIFQPDGYDQTYAEMGPEEKNKISARRMAAEKLAEYLASN